MSRSVRSSLFLMVAPFAVTFTLMAWLVDSKIGPWLDQPLLANCSDRGYPAWFCGMQDDMLPWIALGLGILVLLSVTALLSLSLFRAQLRDLQQNVMDFQKGHRSHLDTDVPREVSPLVQLLNRILQSAMSDPAGATSDRAQDVPSATALGRQAADTPDEQIPPRPAAPTPPPPPRPTADRPAPRPERTHPMEAATPKNRPAYEPETEDLEVSLREMDEDLEKAMSKPEPEPEPEPKRSVPPASARASVNGKPGRAPGSPRRTPATAQSTSGPAKKNQAFPAKKCRKLIAMLGQRYPDVSFDLITDVTEEAPWTIREAELTEVFGQLLDNAGKWAESQVNIFLAIKGNMLVFGVADDGPGVDPELATHLGEDDFRPSADQAPGRGLPVVRRVIDAHGGSLAFDRSRLGGLEAIAAIPGSPAARHASAADHFH